jgi:signal transduction histidine kinase
MGIGLHLSRELVRRHGGDLWFESEEDQGSTFAFSLPLRCLAEQRSDGSGTPRSAKTDPLRAS